MPRCLARLSLALFVPMGVLVAVNAQAKIFWPQQWLGLKRLLRALAGKSKT